MGVGGFGNPIETGCKYSGELETNPFPGAFHKINPKDTRARISTPLLRQSASCIHRKIHTKFCGLDVNAVYTMSQQAKGYNDSRHLY